MSEAISTTDPADANSFISTVAQTGTALIDGMSQQLGTLNISSVESKINTGRSKKDAGDAAFKSGDVKSALRSYHEAIMYLVGVDRNAMNALGMGSPAATPDESKQEEKTEVDVMLEKIYANMSACHIKQENWKRAIETADKALAKNPKNTKALFRKGKALGESGYFEKAETALTEVKKISPAEETIVDAELTRLRAIDNERQKVADKKMRGWLSRDKKA
ncbi:hypothetical protein F5J12DRAFT_811570 [Pisolithus orientalis]|uniref:uncharacterized protein n=1 Tax=Pisolithus orientalis TaxID=936130 RepID=UPI0022241C42|nr:uncharacterized protein F5J12DRAFT_811570 [Pisolithus orientalis]KAI6025959.1 hypothetical protein F5J12DRAFT_811570 [Pisolithus orientalis]